MSTKITVNGVSYSSPDEMPADVRAKYDRAMAAMADRDHNGISDILERPSPAGQANVGVVRTTSRIVVNGKEYGSLDEVPPAMRNLIGGALGRAKTTPVTTDSGLINWGAIGGLIVGFLLGCAAATVYWTRGH
jgi:hypothetical protein